MSVRKRLSLNEKLKIVEDHRKGESVSSLQTKYSLPQSTISTILKSGKKLLHNMEKTNFGCKNRGSMKPGEFERMETKLFSWFQAQRKKHMPINGAILQLKAKEIHKQLYSGTFNASYGWLCRFKKRFGIRLLKQSGEKLSSRADLVKPFKTEFLQLVSEHGLCRDAIFNADETGLFWKVLPERTCVHAGEKSAPGRKISKERISLLVCCNASGKKKIRPLLIGKAQNPRCFRNKALPVDYDSSKKAWMTSTIFKKWFFDSFVPQVESYLEKNHLPKKAILLLDDAPCHPPAEELVKETADGKIWAVYMPPNVTPLIQPMDQNVIRLLKLHYKNSLLSRLIASDTLDVSTFLKKFDLYESTILIALAHKSLSESSIANCWNKIFKNDEEFDEEDNLPLSTLFRQDVGIIGIRNGVQMLNTIFPNIKLCFDDVNQWVEEIHDLQEESVENVENVENVEINFPGEEQSKIKHLEVIKHFEMCIKWSEQNNIDSSKSIVLRELQEEAIRISLVVPQKQTTINQFFKSS